MITLTQLEQITSKNDTFLTPLFQPLVDTLTKYQINTNLRISHFLAQIIFESNIFTELVESLNYSAAGLLEYFPHYFNATTAAIYAHHPDKIANLIYGNRMGNGNEASGQGFLYRGRSVIQITGHDNYAALSKDTGVDFLSNPDLLITPQYMFLAGGWFWNRNHINVHADQNDLSGCTRAVNGGLTDLDHRQNWLNKCQSILK